LHLRSSELDRILSATFAGVLRDIPRLKFVLRPHQIKTLQRGGREERLAESAECVCDSFFWRFAL